MAIVLETSTDRYSTDNPSLFFHHAAVRMTQRSLMQVQTCGEAMSDEVHVQALHILNYAMHLDVEWSLTSALLLQLADKFEKRGHREGWLTFLLQGLHLSQKYDDRIATAELHLHIGYLYQLSGNLGDACTNYAASAAGFAEVGHDKRRARALNRYGFTVWQQQKPRLALQLINDAQQLVDDNHPEYANSLLVKGWIYFGDQNWETSLWCFNQSVVILQASGNQYQLACALRDLGAPLQKLMRYEEAITSYQRAIDLFDKSHNRFQKAVVNMNLGVVYIMYQQATLALQHFNSAEPVFRQLHDQEHLGKLYLNQALAYRINGNLSMSERLLRASIALFNRLGNSAWKTNAVEELQTTLMQMGS